MNYNKIFVTFFGAGLSPIAPGTMGSIAAFLVAIPLFFCSHLPILLGVISLAILLPAGTICSNIYSKKTQQSDPKEIVVDEVCGYFLSLAISLPATTQNFQHYMMILLVNLAFFRFFDIYKPRPISWIDENMKNGFGVMLDDVVAGIFSGCVSISVIELLLR